MGAYELGLALWVQVERGRENFDRYELVISGFPSQLAYFPAILLFRTPARCATASAHV
jgi:hypothetical protein